MKINTKQVVTSVSGESYKNGLQIEGKPAPKDLTIGMAIANILATVKSSDMVKSFDLSNTFYKSSEVDVSVEDIVFIKEVIKSGSELQAPYDPPYIPYILGQLTKALSK